MICREISHMPNLVCITSSTVFYQYKQNKKINLPETSFVPIHFCRQPWLRAQPYWCSPWGEQQEDTHVQLLLDIRETLLQSPGHRACWYVQRDRQIFLYLDFKKIWNGTKYQSNIQLSDKTQTAKWGSTPHNIENNNNNHDNNTNIVHKSFRLNHESEYEDNASNI